MSYAGNMIDLEMGYKELAKNSEGIETIKQVDNLALSDKILQTGIQTTLKTGVDSAVYGTDVKDSFISNLGTSATNAAFQKVGDLEVSNLKEGDLSWKDGSLNKTLAHAVVGGTMSAIKGEDVLAGALSAGVREVTSSASKDFSDDGQLLTSQLTGILVGGLVDGEDGAKTGYNTATSAELYNRRLHKKEVEFIYEAIEDFKMKNKGKTLTGREIEYSDKKALRLLTIAGKYMVDKSSKDNYDAKSRFVDSNEFSKEEINKTIEYLKTESKGLNFIDTYKESMKPQEYFTSTKEQYEDSNHRPDRILGLDNQGIGPIIPIARVGQTLGNTTKEISPVIIQKTSQAYDDVTLGITNKMLNITPKTEQIIDITSDVVNSYLPGVPSYNYIGLGTALIGNYVYEYPELGDDTKLLINKIKGSLLKGESENAQDK